MANPELLQYIRTETSKGAERQTITNTLLSNGWTSQDIDEAFFALNQPLNLNIEKTTIPLPQITTRPSSVKYFEWLMYGGLLLSLANMYAVSGLNIVYAIIPVIFIIGQFILIWLTAHRRLDWARWTIVVWVGIAILMSSPSFIFRTLLVFGQFDLSRILLSVISIVLQIIAFFFIFSRSSNEWFRAGSEQNTPAAASDKPIVNRIWTKGIPGFNIISLIPYLILVFGIDLQIVRNERNLMDFWYMMLAVFGVYSLFFLLEVFVFRRSFATSSSRLDVPILVLIIIRNLIILLNFIPYIQLIGLILGMTVGLAIIVAYVVLIILRYIKRRPQIAVV